MYPGVSHKHVFQAKSLLKIHPTLVEIIYNAESLAKAIFDISQNVLNLMVSRGVGGLSFVSRWESLMDSDGSIYSSIPEIHILFLFSDERVIFRRGIDLLLFDGRRATGTFVKLRLYVNHSFFTFFFREKWKFSAFNFNDRRVKQLFKIKLTNGQDEGRRISGQLSLLSQRK